MSTKPLLETNNSNAKVKFLIGKSISNESLTDIDSNNRVSGNCMTEMKQLCGDPKNITSKECINFFKANKDDTVGMVREFCARAGDLAMKGDNAKICGCLMPKAYYDKYLDDNFGHSPSVRTALASYGPECYSAECGAAELKKPNSELSACPALNVCAQQASVSAGKEISSGQLNNYNSCIFNQFGGNTTQQPKPSPASTKSNNVKAANNAVTTVPTNTSTPANSMSSIINSPIMILVLLIIGVLLTVFIIKPKGIFGGADYDDEYSANYNASYAENAF